MSLNASFERVRVELEEPFTIARGTRTTVENLIVTVTDEGEMTGIGGAAPAAHYGETPDTVAAVLPDLLAVVEEVDDPHALHAIEARMREVVRDNPAARCAVSIAMHDLAAKRLGVPLYRLWGLDPSRAPATSYTIGLDTTDRVREKAAAAAKVGYPILKIKLGTDRDRELVKAVREAAPDATLRIDANEAWTPRETVQKSEWLAERGVEFIEQPVSAENPGGLKFAYERSAIPIAADESCVTLSDIPAITDRCDIANLKLMKTGGLLEARRMIAAAQAHGLEVMLGCMIGTNASILAAAQLAPLLDYADLDGSLLLSDDPYEGVDLTGGKIRLAEHNAPGIGVRSRE